MSAALKALVLLLPFAVLFVALRLQGIMHPPILLFVLAMVLVAEVTLSIDR